MGCQDTYLPLPAGWEISPQDSDSIAATAAHPWGTRVLVYADGGQRYTLNENSDDTSPGQALEWYCCSNGRTALGTSSDGTQYKANACARRILLRAPPSTCTGTDAAPTPPRLESHSKAWFQIPALKSPYVLYVLAWSGFVILAGGVAVYFAARYGGADDDERDARWSYMCVCLCVCVCVCIVCITCICICISVPLASRARIRWLS